MWWQAPALRGFQGLFPPRLVSLIAKSYVLVSADMQARGAAAGRLLESAFYRLSQQSGMQLCDRAGSKSLFKFSSSSGYNHELDASIAERGGMSVWELKRLSSTVQKNDLLIFNSKILDYFQSFDSTFGTMPLYRFLLTTSDVEPACRHYGACGGIIVVDPHLLPIPLLHEAIGRGMTNLPLNEALRAAELLRWTCRPLQEVMCDLCHPPALGIHHPSRRAEMAMNLQLRLSAMVIDRLHQEYPDWEGELLVQSWSETGGWVYQSL